MKFHYPDGATPLDPDELHALIPPDIATQDQLNQVEQKNIIDAELWLFAQKRMNILSETFIKKLHSKMFERVWKWAGKYRTTEKNLGIAPYSIQEEIFKLLKDIQYWIEHQTYPWDEVGARFHHRLVSIHPFPNGNGRHARLMTDIVMAQNNQTRFSWGANSGFENLQESGSARKTYIHSLQKADARNYEDLIKFVRS